MSRRICVVTGTRADYGLLRWVMEGIATSAALRLQVVATGMHLSPEFGLTYREIERDGFSIDRKVEMLLSSDSAVGVAKSMGLGLIGFADAFAELEPDIVVLLGDRFELLSAAAAALVARTPIAHIHGGETSEGAYDESLRHALTKMAYWHFVATREYQRRVIQLGEAPERVFVVGGLGVDGIKRSKLLDRTELETELGFKFRARNLLVTFHPATLSDSSAEAEMKELLAALADLRDTGLIFTLPNADTGGRGLMEVIDEFVARHANSKAYTSLGQLRYLSCMAQVDAVVGNSSSGLLEAPTLRKATINIGDRQKGRLQATSVVNSMPTRDGIAAALREIYTAAFQKSLKSVTNPYGDGGASDRVVETLERVPLTSIPRKPFYDLPVESLPE